MWINTEKEPPNPKMGAKKKGQTLQMLKAIDGSVIHYQD